MLKIICSRDDTQTFARLASRTYLMSEANTLAAFLVEMGEKLKSKGDN